MFLTISHVFAAMFSFCALVSDFPMESWSCCHGGQTQISRPKNLKYIFINIEIWNQMLICRIDTEMYILTKIFSGICAIWHNSALCHPAPNCKKSLGPGFAPMCSSLYSPQGFDTFPIPLIFILCVDLDEDPYREPAYSAGFHFEGPYSSIQALWQNAASHPKTQFIPGTASSILGGQIVRFLLPSLGGGDTIAPLFIFDLHPPQNRQTDSFMLNNLL